MSARRRGGAKHRAGRQDSVAVDALIPRQRGSSRRAGRLIPGPRHAATPCGEGLVVDQPTIANTLQVNVDRLDALDAYSAASIARRHAHTAIVRTYQVQTKLRLADRIPGRTSDAAHLSRKITRHVAAVQGAETRLAAALDTLERQTTRVLANHRTRSLYYLYGGRLVCSPATHRHLADRLALAENAADAARTIAHRAVRVLLREATEAQLFAATVDRLVDNALDQASTAAAAAEGAAPPTILRLVQAALPAAERHEWWREVCALFAEATPAERRAARLSLLLHAPVTIWTTWAIARNNPQPAAETPRRGPTPSDNPAPWSDHQT